MTRSVKAGSRQACTAEERRRFRGKGQLAIEQMKREVETRTRSPLEVARERWARLSLRPESEMSDLLETELSRYPTLRHGWDGYSAKPASPNSLRDARKFLSMRPADVPLPYPGLDTEGEVELYWKAGGLSAAVMFEGDGSFYFYVRRFSDGKEVSLEMGEDLPVDSDWPEVLAGPLRELWGLGSMAADLSCKDSDRDTPKKGESPRSAPPRDTAGSGAGRNS